ncbi:hypothetical protein AKJ66_02905 [candidate division MSBL1 archaeon SCGC-AAA259E22]|uniref:Uncharacterized protein n=1 Tax=candidate division MSBL1 archaeon SCGC-AAA259E22 TaxID=1698265 RepID=A0A133UFU5_9EURY|nr:hypothetical protein AKJ66_02905 [candidate division MSBL1 archaeon SCGC-AAA259E22]
MSVVWKVRSFLLKLTFSTEKFFAYKPPAIFRGCDRGLEIMQTYVRRVYADKRIKNRFPRAPELPREVSSKVLGTFQDERLKEVYEKATLKVLE